jgi:hypothetical protein
MSTVRELETRRNAILEEMRSIRSMRRGTINEQYLKVPHKGKKEPVTRGPYHLFSRREGNKTVGYRLTTQEELEQAQKDVTAHKHFIELCKEFESLTEKMGELLRLAEGTEKKLRRS